MRIAGRLSSLTLALLPLLLAHACTTPGYNASIDPNATPTPNPFETPKPKPSPPEQKKYEFECRILNNEGRVFTARGTSEAVAEGTAMRACRINYRRCSKMRCDVVQVLGD